MKKYLLLLLIPLYFLSCNDETELPPVQYKISEDVCIACAEDPFFIICIDTMAATNILTPNSDGMNDVLTFYIVDTDSLICNLATELWVYNRNGIELAYYDDYAGGQQGWPEYNSSNNSQNTENLDNGLYKFKISKGEESKTGYFIIILNIDEYLDISLYKLPCVDSCFIYDHGDPFLDAW